MMTVTVLRGAESFSQVGVWAWERGLAGVLDSPLTYDTRRAAWSDGQRTLTLLSRSGARHALAVIEGEGGEALARELGARFGGVEVPWLVDELRRAAAEGPRARARALVDLSVVLFLAPGPEAEAAIEAIGEVLLDDEPVLRYLAALLLDITDRRAEAALAAAVEEHPDLAPTLAAVRARCQAADDGTLYDGPTDRWYELEDRAEAGAAAGQWKRVVKASEDLLAQDAGNRAGLYYRGLAHEAQGEPLLALALLGAAVESLDLEIKVAEESRAKYGNEGASDTTRDRERLTDARVRIAALRERGVAAADLEPLIEKLAAWQAHESICAAGAAAAIRGLVPELEPLLAFVEGAYRGRLEDLEAAYAAAPDAPAVALRRAEVLTRSDPAAGRAALEAVLAALRAPPAQLSPAAALIARVAPGPSSAADVVHQLAASAYEAKDYEAAERYADELVRLAPDDLQAWQYRAQARLFALKYEEAAEAFADAVREIDRIYRDGEARGSVFFGDDPRPMMHFNRACAFGRLGRKDDALDSLRRAVRGHEKWAEEAKTEDWIECLWGTPELEAITRKETRALATREELDPAFVRSLIDQCKGGFYAGRVAEAREAGERAAELAEWIGDVPLRVEAMAALGYTLAFSGEAGRAVDRLARAVALAEPAGAVPPALLAETVHTSASALHEHGALEAAERAYRRGLELRRAANGADAPVLAKSYGDLARLQTDQGRPAEEVAATIGEGAALLERFLGAHTDRDDQWLEATVDLATLQVNLGHTLARGGEIDRAIESLGRAVATFEQLATESRALNPALLDNARGLARSLALDDRGAAQALLDRLDVLRFPGSPAERDERLFFERLRGFVRFMRARGSTDAELAGTLSQALRGVDALPPDLRSVPAIASLPAELASHTARFPELAVMAPMALDLAATDLDRALDDLEGLCVSCAIEAEAE